MLKPTAVEAGVLAQLNVQRKAHGLSKLTFDATLAQYARAHTQSMLKKNYFDHDTPGGPTFAQRMAPLLKQSGRNYAEENIEYGTGTAWTAKELVADWMASPGHRANILNPKVHRTGQGIEVGKFQGYPVATVATSDFSN